MSITCHLTVFKDKSPSNNNSTSNSKRNSETTVKSEVKEASKEIAFTTPETTSERTSTQTSSKAIHSDSDNIDRLLAGKKAKKTYRGFYFDSDIQAIIDNVDIGVKSELINECLRKVLL